MKKFSRLVLKFFISDELPFEDRILNFTCFLGFCAALISFIARLIEGMPLITISTMYIMMAAILGLFCVSALRLAKVRLVTSIVVLGLGTVFFPVLYFTNGGADSGMAAYFGLAIFVEFLLLKGKTRAAALILTTVATVMTYVTTLFLGWDILPVGGMNNFQRFVDNMQSIFVVGFFIGVVVLFQNSVYLKEKNKAEAAGAEIMRSEELLTLVNEAASLLLTTEPDRFNETLKESMGKMAACLDIDCVYIWRDGELDGIPSYTLLHRWMSPSQDNSSSFESVAGSDKTPRMAGWDDRMFGPRGYLSELAVNFTGPIGEKLAASGIKAIMAFPVFFQGSYWGFASFENRHSERLCSDREAAILQSGSLLLANAVERNDNLLQLGARLAQQQLMSNISKRFISKEPMGVLIRDALALMGTFLGVARVLIAVFEKNSEISRPEYVWISDTKYTPTMSQKGFSGILKELFPRFHNNAEDIQSIYCDNALTYDNGRFKLLSERGGLKSFICAPIYVEGEMWGVMSVEEHETFRNWNESDSQLVSMVGNAISNAVARDIMEKERAAALDQAIAASRAKGDFLSNMSHEIRTPMNAIIGMTSIGKSSQTLEKKDYAFEKIDGASKHLLGVINDILDMSKIEANKLELSLASFDFENMLQKAVNVINFRVDERKQHFYINIDNDIPQILIGDDQRLAQVITNLLSNAVKFTPEEGSIYLDAKLLSEADGVCRIQITVTDTGIGITDEQKSRLFHSFEQAEAGTSRKYGGTGLGLAISKRIVELMGGEIWVESDAGQGSRFIFTAVMHRGSLERQRMLPEGIDLSNIRIFVVDDEPEIREFFMKTAENLGIICDVASSAEEGLELLALEENHDIYFLDWKLPGMNGVDLARRIREKTRRKSIVILFSSIDWSVIEDDARNAGVDKFLPKPLFQSAITDLINESIGVYGTEERIQSDGTPDNFAGFTILLAEDVEINREIVLALLEPTNLTVDCAVNGAQALEMFQGSPEKYDMIFMDVQMPEMDGYEATRRIRALKEPRAKKVPIVAMTANVFREDIEKCLAAGMNNHVGKPLDLGEVMVILRQYLSTR